MQLQEHIASINQLINTFIWGPGMLVCMIGIGVYFTVFTGFLPLRKIKMIYRSTLGELFKKKEKKGGVSPFQALSTALAGTMGIGNIAGVATAITVGGPGSIFWMWVSAFFGMSTKFAEIILATKYRKRDAKGEWLGGPMVYLREGVGSKVLSVMFVIFATLASFGIGNIAQVNSISSALDASFQIPPLATGIVIAVLAGMCILGGTRQIAKITAIVIPFISLFYIGGGLFVLGCFMDQVVPAFLSIFQYAFQPVSALGGFAGAAVSAAIRFGISRGVFTNEAGLGSASIAHASAEIENPVKQGFWGMFEVFADTIVVCTLTALIILSTGVWIRGSTGAALTAEAFDMAMPGFGGKFIAVSIVFFAFATLLSWSFYGQKCISYYLGNQAIWLYKLVFVLIIVLGATANLDLMWEISDTLNGLMAIPNLIALFILRKEVLSITKINIKNI